VFFTHLLVHQFEVVVRHGCEAMVHGFQVTLDIHLNWVVLLVEITNAFNTISLESHFLGVLHSRRLVV
jgi:hypothetical protein